MNALRASPPKSQSISAHQLTRPLKPFCAASPRASPPCPSCQPKSPKPPQTPQAQAVEGCQIRSYNGKSSVKSCYWALEPAVRGRNLFWPPPANEGRRQTWTWGRPAGKGRDGRRGEGGEEGKKEEEKIGSYHAIPPSTHAAHPLLPTTHNPRAGPRPACPTLSRLVLRYNSGPVPVLHPSVPRPPRAPRSSSPKFFNCDNQPPSYIISFWCWASHQALHFGFFIVVPKTDITRFLTILLVPSTNSRLLVFVTRSPILIASPRIVENRPSLRDIHPSTLSRAHRYE